MYFKYYNIIFRDQIGCEQVGSPAKDSPGPANGGCDIIQ